MNGGLRSSFNKTEEKFSHLKGGGVILIENIRFFKEETEDDQIFSKKLGSLGDIYINDAFSCSHRKQASVHSITKFVKKSYAGPLLKKEIKALTAKGCLLEKINIEREEKERLLQEQRNLKKIIIEKEKECDALEDHAKELNKIIEHQNKNILAKLVQKLKRDKTKNRLIK